MPDCPHIHVQDSGLQAFRAFIREETDGGRDIVRFLKGAINREYSNYEPHHEIQAAKILANYGYEEAVEIVRQHNESKPKRSSPDNGPASRNPIPENAEDRDSAIDDFRDLIREETDNGLTIVRSLVHTMQTRERPYKPNHNLDAARQLTDYGFPVTGDLLCATECTHHAPAQPDTVEGDGAADSTEGETAPDPAWLETLQEIKRMEDEGEIDKVDYDPFKPVYDWAPKEEVMPYADEVADAFRAELDLRAERRASWPEIEERRRKKHAEIYPSHSDDDTEDPPDT